MLDCFRLIIECVSMSPQTSRQKVAATSQNTSDVEAARKPKSHHRRYQKLCTTERLPALFTWVLLFVTSFLYWICVLPEMMIILSTYQPILIFHCILFVLLSANFILATFMDPVRSNKIHVFSKI